MIKKKFTIFIPTTPNPTSGFLAVLAEGKILEMNMTVEDAIKMILTGGMVKPEKSRFIGLKRYRIVVGNRKDSER